MAAVDSLISQANFSTSWAQTWSDQHINKDQTRYVYICAPVWYFLADCWYYAFGGSGVWQAYFSYWDGSAWSSETHIEFNGASSTDGVTAFYGHNRNEGGPYYKGQFTGTNLWRIRYWPSRSNTRWKITLWAGGWGMAKNSDGTVMNYPKDSKIYSIGRTGSNVNIYASGTTDASSDVVNSIFNSNNRTGSPILASCDHELINIPWRS